MYAGLYTRGSGDPEALAGERQPFLSANQAVALKTVMNAITRGAAICLMTGAEGVGKTVMLNQLAAALSKRPGHVVRLAEPLPQPLALQGLIAGSLGLHGAERLSPTEMAAALQAQPSADGEHHIFLLVDDAHTIEPKTLSYLELLHELLGWRRITLQVVLAGHGELVDTLRTPMFASMLRGVGVHVVVDRFSPQETRDYLDHRLAWAGLSARSSMTQPALEDVLAYAGANPRRIDAFVGQMLRQRVRGRGRRVTRKLLRARSLIPREAVAAGGEGLLEWRPERVALPVLAVLVAAGLAWWYGGPLLTQVRGTAGLARPPVAVSLPVVPGEQATAVQADADAEVARLVGAAQAQIASDHVASPPGNNALETLRTIDNLALRASAAGRRLAMAMPSRFSDLASAAEAGGRQDVAARFRLVARVATAMQAGTPPPAAEQPIPEPSIAVSAPGPSPDMATMNDFRLPMTAPAHVMLSYPHGDADARANSAFLAETLRGAGFWVEESPLPRHRRVSSRINYFFAEDRGAATDISRRLEGLLGRRRPVQLGKRESTTAPGTIEVILP